MSNDRRFLLSWALILTGSAVILAVRFFVADQYTIPAITANLIGFGVWITGFALQILVSVAKVKRW